MYTQHDLEDAVDQGIFNRDDVARFEAHVASRKKKHEIDEERFRLIGGFNDIFVVIACAMTLISTVLIGSSLSYWVGYLATALVAWGLAESFVRRRRMALPAIVLLLAFVASCVALAVDIVFQAMPSNFNSGVFCIGFGVAALAAGLHWLRFKVPMAIAVGIGAALAFLTLLVLRLVTGADDAFTGELLDRFSGWIFFACGVVVFVAAMRWDMRDTQRKNEKSDIAFWLHLLAAPLLVHPVFSAMAAGSADGVSLWQALSIVVLYLAVGTLSLAIDRRALMVASLSYVLAVFANLLLQYGMVSMNFALTALVVGAGLLVLSSQWHWLRAVVLQRLPAGVVPYLPPVQ